MENRKIISKEGILLSQFLRVLMKSKPRGRLPLNGGIPTETSTGETNNFAPDEVILVEDTNGKGHRTKNLEAKRRRLCLLVFNEELIFLGRTMEAMGNIVVSLTCTEYLYSAFI